MQNLSSGGQRRISAVVRDRKELPGSFAAFRIRTLRESRGGSRAGPVHINGLWWTRRRLCRPALRKGFAFPCGSAPFLFLYPGWKAEPFQPGWRRFSRMVARRKGKAFPHSKRRSRRPKPVVWSVVWTSLAREPPPRFAFCVESGSCSSLVTCNSSLHLFDHEVRGTYGSHATH